MPRNRQRLDRTADGKLLGGTLDGKATGFRCSGSLRAHMAAAAAAAELSVSAWLRAAVVESSGAPPEDLMPTKPVEASVAVPVELAAVGALDRHVRRLNGSIVQLTKELRIQGIAELHAEVEVELTHMREIQRRFRTYLERVAASETAARRL